MRGRFRSLGKSILLPAVSSAFAKVTAVISVRVDSADRIRNLGLVLNILTRDYPGMTILVIEHSDKPSLQEFVEERAPGCYHFRRSEGCFHKSRVLNEGAALATSPYVLFYDSDVFVVPAAMFEALRLLESHSADVVFPYNGAMLQVRSNYQEEFLRRVEGPEELPVYALEEVPVESERFEYLYGEKRYPCTGGAVIVRRETFFRIGGYNENILSYSCEDVEFSTRVQRLLPDRLRYIERANIYHFEHKRGADSRYNGFHAHNLAEWKRVESMPVGELWYYCQNRFRHFRGDTSLNLLAVNEQGRYSIELSDSERSPFAELALVWNLTGERGKEFERFLVQAEKLLSDYLVFLVEIGGYKHSSRRHSTNLLYLQLPTSAGRDWLKSVSGSTDRPHILVCGPQFRLELQALTEARERVRQKPHQAVAVSDGLYFHRELVDLPGFPEAVSGPRDLQSWFLAQGVHVQAALPAVSPRPEVRKLYRKTVKEADNVLRSTNSLLRRLIARPSKRAGKTQKGSREPAAVSLVLTTYGDQSRLTQACLEKISEWKQSHHEVVVVVHDETPLLRAYLESQRRAGVIDRLLLAVSKHGHLAGVNLGFAEARHPLVFNLCIDVFLGPYTLDRCASMLSDDPGLGLVGWHYDWALEHEGTFWRDDGTLDYTIRKTDSWMRREGQVNAEELIAICSSPWYTGKTLGAAGTDRILCVNGSFFGTRKAYWDRVGGFDDIRFRHYWADDHLCYALLDQGLNIANLPKDIRCSQRPAQFYSRSDWKWQGKDEPLDHKDELFALGRPALSDLDSREIDFLVSLFLHRKPVVLGDFPDDWFDEWRQNGLLFKKSGAPPENADCLLVSGDSDLQTCFQLLSESGVLVSYRSQQELKQPGETIGSFTVWRKDAARYDKRRSSQTNLGLSKATSWVSPPG